MSIRAYASTYDARRSTLIVGRFSLVARCSLLLSRSLVLILFFCAHFFAVSLPPSFPSHILFSRAFVEEASPNIEDIKNHLGEFHYITKTRGERTAHGSRIVAEALYEIAMDEEGKHSYLFYDLEFPHTPEEPQKAFNVEKEGIVLMQVKNPHAGREATREGGIPAGLQGKMKVSANRHQHMTGAILACACCSLSRFLRSLFYTDSRIILSGCRSISLVFV